MPPVGGAWPVNFPAPPPMRKPWVSDWPNSCLLTGPRTCSPTSPPVGRTPDPTPPSTIATASTSGIPGSLFPDAQCLLSPVDSCLGGVLTLLHSKPLLRAGIGDAPAGLAWRGPPPTFWQRRGCNLRAPCLLSLARLPDLNTAETSRGSPSFLGGA